MIVACFLISERSAQKTFMLNITFKQPDYDDKGWIMYPGIYFDHLLDMSILQDTFVQKLVVEIDKSEVLSNNVIMSPIFGPIPPKQLSGGVKTLIVLYAQDKPVTGLSLGNNTVSSLLEIADKKDITIYLGHPLEFPKVMNAVCIDNGSLMHSDGDFDKQWLLTRGYSEEDFND